MEEVLKYSLRPFPRALATNEGDLVKTVKAKLLHAIEEEVQGSSVDLPVGEKAYILDAMAMLQTLTVLPVTFGELAIDLLIRVATLQYIPISNGWISSVTAIRCKASRI